MCLLKKRTKEKHRTDREEKGKKEIKEQSGTEGERTLVIKITLIKTMLIRTVLIKILLII